VPDPARRDSAVARPGRHATVRERTADLTRLNRFLAHVTQLSARLIDLPLVGYDDALRSALAELARELGVGACALAEADEAGVWRWRWSGGPCAALVADGNALPDGCADAIDASGPDALPQPHEALSCAVGAPVLLLGRRASADAAAGSHLLACIDATPDALADARADQLRLVAEVLFGALTRWHGLLDLERTRQQLLQQSRTDPLTGLANRRAFDERKLDELRRARRGGEPLTVMMLDIDHFKRYNDRYGHAAGDDCLVRVAHALQALFQRPFDCVARMGGEEFALLLPGLPAAGAPAQAQRVLQAIEALAIAHADSPFTRVSVSLGAATIERHDDEPLVPAFERLLRDADDALYRAKAAGRNTALMAHPR
jgi:diguanylate cyclase (GGDEF)-like protein